MHNDIKKQSDIIVIGSGMAGLHAAYTPTLAGLRVTMLDVGFDEYAPLEKGLPKSFEETRGQESAQYKTFLGEDLSGISAYEHDVGYANYATSGRRSYITQNATLLSPIESEGVSVVQSFSCGGLSEAWGGVCDFFDSEECRTVGIPADKIGTHYQTIVDRIGVSGEHMQYQLQSPANIDDNAAYILDRYRSREKHIGKLGFRVERAMLALLTKDLGNRKQTAYRDMDFWDNIGRSVYRGHYTLEELRARKHFRYVPGVLVKSIVQKNGMVIVYAKNINTGSVTLFEAKTAIVAAGALNSTKILVQSFDLYYTKMPIILKNNYNIPGLMLRRLGKISHPSRHSLCQLTMSGIQNDHGMVDSYIQYYSYNSLLLHKLIRFMPLPAPEALNALSILTPSMMIADVRFPSTADTHAFSMICKHADGTGILRVASPDSPGIKNNQDGKVKVIKQAMRALGIFPLRAVRNPYGATSHYAGGIPYSNRPGIYPLSVDENGKLHNSERIFIADMSTWNALPAKPPSLTLMANADRIGVHVCQRIISGSL